MAHLDLQQPADMAFRTICESQTGNMGCQCLMESYPTAKPYSLLRAQHGEVLTEGRACRCSPIRRPHGGCPPFGIRRPTWRYHSMWRCLAWREDEYLKTFARGSRSNARRTRWLRDKRIRLGQAEDRVGPGRGGDREEQSGCRFLNLIPFVSGKLTQRDVG
ncbi:hypothetical protein CALVIDRAFT_539555 [Calocera viscosa TUFC12733]|uniref:Uncharacterized protein n=1 Tax=Calocera viscosa (strain TUFC12733) TaxID=1330018 RepID=A0A167JU57_CALVF|nr:hypothetical protein CALVIDRAFT_539555 [Calocera viscosa TUFC12733]